MKNNNSTHWDSKTIITLKSEFKTLVASGKSERQAAESLGVPRSTLQNWNKSMESTGLPQAVVEFFSTEVGFAFLHVLHTAIVFAISKISKSGLRIAQLIFEITGLNKLFASSYGKLQQDSALMDDHIIEFEELEKPRLSENMPKKKITITQDETNQKGKPHLIGIEPVSNFIITEAQSDKRDAASWNQAMQEGLSGLNIEVIQATSDQGSALKKYRNLYLNEIHYSPDLFHIQNEVHKATAGPLASKRRSAQKKLGKAEQQLSRNIEKKQTLEEKGQTKHLENKINKVSKSIQASGAEIESAQSRLTKISTWENQISQAIAMISQVIIRMILTQVRHKLLSKWVIFLKHNSQRLNVSQKQWNCHKSALIALRKRIG